MGGGGGAGPAGRGAGERSVCGVPMAMHVAVTVYIEALVSAGRLAATYVPADGEDVAAAEEETKSETEPETEIVDLTGNAGILLVEDEEAVRTFAARALTSRGYKVFEAPSGVEALDVMKESGDEVDLVVSDVVMPELDGPSLLTELRKTRPNLKIIFISGYAEDAFKKNLPDNEDFHFLAKPFSLKQLAIAVKETLGR